MTEQEIIDGVGALAADDVDKTVQLVTGIWVGLMEAFIELRDPGGSGKQITITGGHGQREVTLHAKP